MSKMKGFTLVELLAVLAIIGILSGIAIGGISKYLEQAKADDFSMLEKNIKVAVDNYFVEHSSEIPAIGRSKTILATELLSQGYLDKFNDPDQKSENCNLVRSRVTVTRGGSREDFNMTLDYKVCVYCSKRRSSGC